jgi:hypothetical protein
VITNSLNSKINSNLFNPIHNQRNSNPLINANYSKFKRSNNSLQSFNQKNINNSFNKIIPCKMSFSQIYANQKQIQSIINLNNKLNDIVKNNIINENVTNEKKRVLDPNFQKIAKMKQKIQLFLMKKKKISQKH